MKRFFIILVCIHLIAISAYSQRRAITVNDLWNMKRIGKFTLSADGQWIAFTMTEFNIEKNNNNSDIYLVSTSGDPPLVLTR